MIEPPVLLADEPTGTLDSKMGQDILELDIEWNGLEYPPETFYQLMGVGRAAGTSATHAHEEQFDLFFDRLPKEFIFEHELLPSRLWRAPAHWKLRSETT